MKIKPMIDTDSFMKGIDWTPAVGSPLVRQENDSDQELFKKCTGGSSDRSVKIGCHLDAARSKACETTIS